MTAPAQDFKARLRALEDREAVGQAIVAYGFSFDRRDQALHRSLFADEIEMDFSASIGSGLTRMPADDWVAAVRPFFENLPATQHVAYPLMTEIMGERPTPSRCCTRSTTCRTRRASRCSAWWAGTRTGSSAPRRAGSSARSSSTSTGTRATGGSSRKPPAR